VLIGIVLSYLHDTVQLLAIPLGEWARITFLVNATNEALATNLVNFVYQLATFAIAYALALALMTVLMPLTTMLYPSVAFIAQLVFGLWWVPLGFVFGFQSNLEAVLPFLPISLLAAVLVFFLLTPLAVKRYVANRAA